MSAVARLTRWWAQAQDESGQGMVEYAFILVLMVLVLIVMVTLIGHQTLNFYSNISNGFPR